MYPFADAPYLGALSDIEGGYRVSEAVAMAVGLPVLLLIVAGAVTLFLRYGRPLERYDYLDEEPIELAYGVEGVVRKRHGAMVRRHTMLGHGFDRARSDP